MSAAELNDVEQQEVLENIPENLRQLRACLTCRLIKTMRQWDQGCPNCGWDNTMTNTTPVFKGSAGAQTHSGRGVKALDAAHPAAGCLTHARLVLFLSL